MTASFYADVHGKLAVVQGLRSRGIDVLRTQDDGMDEADEPDVLDRATELHRVLITQDDDFLVETARRQRLGIPSWGGHGAASL